MGGVIKSKVDMDKVQKWYDKHKNYAYVAELVTREYNMPVVGSHVRYWLTAPKREPVKMKVLLFDIETSPIIAYVWGLFNQNISIKQIRDDWQVLMYAAKWLGSREIMYAAQDAEGSELDVLQSVWQLLDEADIVVAHNAQNFDVKKLNAKFLEYGLTQPSYYKVVDTLKIARAKFGFTSNKLDYISQLLGDECKNETNFQLWIDCMEGCPKAWKKMIDYCIQDVRLLEKAYVKLRAWDSRHPKVVLDYVATCNACGDKELVYVQDYNTAASTFEVFQCEKCGHQQRARVNIANDLERKNRGVSV